MKGVIADKPGAGFHLVDNLEKPKPGQGQVLVKSICTAVNPVDSYMSNYGMLVVEWPMVLGCDASGVVVEVGEGVEELKEGDGVCGCSRLGHLAHSTCQEYFLMDARLTIPKPKNVTFEQAATLGVGTYTASLGLFNGLNISLPDPDSPPAAKDDWLLVLGGSSSVGKYAIQLANFCGYRVIASCSAKSADMVKALGAAATLDYKQPEDAQLETLKTSTGGSLTRIFDAAATNQAFARRVFEELKGDDGQTERYFTTTNDWDEIPAMPSAKTFRIQLGAIGRPDADADALNADIARFVPVIRALVERGSVAPNEYGVVGSTGFESAVEAVGVQQRGELGARKVVVKLQEE